MLENQDGAIRVCGFYQGFSSYKLLLAHNSVHSVHLMKSGVPHINVAMNKTVNGTFIFKGGSKGRKQSNCCKSCCSHHYSHITLGSAGLGQVIKNKTLIFCER